MLYWHFLTRLMEGGIRMNYKEKFQEMDLLSNFMINTIATDPEVAEPFCKMLLRELLHRDVEKVRIVAEKIIVGDVPQNRGVRLDVEVDEYDESGEKIANVYDIEPHRDKEKDYPKKNRYSQAQIDKKHMKSGDKDFSHLPDLYLICITNYDPFGYNQMVYTIKNTCLEVPQMCYNDGVRILYFNTKGTEGGTESLKNFLNYLEESTDKNVVDEATKEAHKIVTQVKNRRTDMTTVGDLIDNIVREETETLEAELASKNTEITTLYDAIDKKDAEIELLKAQIEAQKN